MKDAVVPADRPGVVPQELGGQIYVLGQLGIGGVLVIGLHGGEKQGQQGGIVHVAGDHLHEGTVVQPHVLIYGTHIHGVPGVGGQAGGLLQKCSAQADIELSGLQIAPELHMDTFLGKGIQQLGIAGAHTSVLAIRQSLQEGAQIHSQAHSGVHLRAAGHDALQSAVQGNGRRFRRTSQKKARHVQRGVKVGVHVPDSRAVLLAVCQVFFQIGKVILG